jgi:hypothetical protein
MPQIDFLPEKYRQRDVHRKNRWTRTVVILAFVGLLAAGSFALRKKRASVAAELDLARQSYDTMMTQTTELSKEIVQLSEARGQANLIAFLRHPWSRARIVAAVVQHWPQSLVLEELRIQREGQGGVVPIAPAPVPGQPPKPPAQADLLELGRDVQNRPAVVLVSGLMSDHAVLHRYLAELGKIDLFSNVELLGMVPADAAGILRFNVRLTVAPGYGQRGGPPAPSRLHSTATGGRQSARAAETTRQPVTSAVSLSPVSVAPVPKFLPAPAHEDGAVGDTSERGAGRESPESEASEAEIVEGESAEDDARRTYIADPGASQQVAPQAVEEDEP